MGRGGGYALFAVIRHNDVECSKHKVEFLVDKVDRVIGRNLVFVVVDGSVQLLLLFSRHLLLEVGHDLTAGSWTNEGWTIRQKRLD